MRRLPISFPANIFSVFLLSFAGHLVFLQKKGAKLENLTRLEISFPPVFPSFSQKNTGSSGQSEQHHLGTRAAGDQDLGAWDLIETHGFSMGKSWDNARNARRVPWVWWLGESSNSSTELDGQKLGGLTDWWHRGSGMWRFLIMTTHVVFHPERWNRWNTGTRIGFRESSAMIPAILRLFSG